ncbi:MAG: helix-turn-helix transcriptional regulator, partial [Mesorhizobium sp.]
MSKTSIQTSIKRSTFSSGFGFCKPPSWQALLSGEQSKAARALLSWSRVRLAARAHISEPTIIEFENGSKNPNPR